jgi:hypothetical protein
MMTAWTLKLRPFTPPQLPGSAAFRTVAAGTLWGLLLSGGLLTLTYYNCSVICLGDAFVTTALSVAAGIGTVGPAIVLAAKH